MYSPITRTMSACCFTVCARSVDTGVVLTIVVQRRSTGETGKGAAYVECQPDNNRRRLNKIRRLTKPTDPQMPGCPMFAPESMGRRSTGVARSNAFSRRLSEVEELRPAFPAH